MADSAPIKLDVIAARLAIATIQSLDLRSESIEQIKQLLIPVFRGYQVRAPRFPPGLRLFRARLCDKPTNIRELSYPPAHLVTLGRANRPGTPVLYCSAARGAVFFESRPPVGSTVAIVQWETTSPLLVNHVGYTREAFGTIGSGRTQAGWSREAAEIPALDGVEEIVEFLAKLFTRRVAIGEEGNYKLTVAVAEKLFADDLFGGLLYPAVAMRANADNFALKSQYADNHLRFVKAELARIDAELDFGYQITVLDTAGELGGDGSIQWRGRLDQWTLRNKGDQLSFVVENGSWVARDSDGKVVEPG